MRRYKIAKILAKLFPLCLSACPLLIIGCSQPQLETPPITKTDTSSACARLDMSIVNAEWAKAPAVQHPHLLVVNRRGDPRVTYGLGIDRSPDFFFKIIETEFHDFTLIKGVTRFFAYDCRNGELQELDLSLEAGTDILDAQTGQITDIKTHEDGSIFLALRDYKTLEFKLEAARRAFIRQ